jgi:NADH:ubiquinone oxidoreductase subunit 2 (subunit N)
MLFPRILALGVWALSLTLMRERIDDLKFRSVQGIGRHNSVVVLGVLIPHFSLAGFPLLAGFPVLLTLWTQLAQRSSTITILVFLSSISLLIGGVRSLAVFVMGSDEMASQEKLTGRASQLLIILGISTILLAGIFPGIIFNFVGKIIGLR